MPKRDHDSDPNLVLNSIYDQIIPIDSAEKKKNVQVVQDIVKKKLITKMKDMDPLFKCLYQEIYHSGSYWDGLRVKDANEFDLNVLLKLPIHPSKLKFIDKEATPGFVRLGFQENPSFLIERTNPCYAMCSRLENKLLERDDAAGMWFLRPDKTRSWIEGLISKAIYDVKDEIGVEFIIRKAGPSMNLTFFTPHVVDVDFVPAFGFNCQELRHLSVIYSTLEKRRGWENKRFAMIPKPAPSSLAAPKQVKKYREWRLDFHDHEGELIVGEVKPMIKLLKAFRDSNSALTGLYSYCLKTVVMNMMKDKKVQFEANKRGDSFLATLKYLLEKLQLGNIPMYFHHQSNLISKLNQQQITGMASWLGKAIGKLEKSANTSNCKKEWSSFFNITIQ